MLKGTVKICARISEPDKRVFFSLFDFNTNEPGVDKVEIEAPNDSDEIRTVVHFSEVADPDTADAVAMKVHIAAMNRISFWYDVAIEDGRVTEHQFTPVSPTPNVISIQAAEMLLTGNAVKFSRGLAAAKLKLDLEQPNLPGEHYFGLFRSALLSKSPVEKFMHLYNLLLMFFHDSQEEVDGFILRENPSTPLTPGWHRGETVYTRLRNQFGHHKRNQRDANLEQTKVEMENRLGELITLTKQAIKLSP